MHNMHHLGLGGLFVFMTCLFISIFVYSKDTKRWLNRIWAIFALSVAIFGFGLFKVDTASTKEVAFFWWQFMYVGVIFIGVLYLHFGMIFLDIQNRKVLYFLYPVNFVFLMFNLFSRLLLKSLTWKFSNIWYADAGILFVYFFLLWWGSVVYAMYLLYKGYKTATGIRRNQIKYWWLAGVVGYFGGIFCYLPIFNINIIYPYPIYLIAIWPLIITFAIIKYRLWEIDTVIHRTLLWILTLLLVILPIGLVVTLSFDWIITLSRIGKLALTSAVLIFFVWYYNQLKPHIDHLFRRRKYDYYQVLGEIGQKIGSELDINRVISRLFKELKEVLYIRNDLILVQQPGQLDYTEAGSIGYEQLLGQEKKQGATLNHDTPLSQWINQHHRALEREQIEVDPQYVPIKEEALVFFNQNSIEVLIPVIMENKVNALIGIGKKENLSGYRLEDIRLLEHIGRQIGLTVDNALRHENIVEKERLMARKVSEAEAQARYADILQENNRELEIAYQEKDQAYEELRATQAQLIQSAKMAAVGQLSAGVAHEINNPLGGILGYTQFILEKLGKPEFSLDDFKTSRKYLEYIERESQRCKQIVEHLLSFSRKSTEKFALVDIKSTMETILSILRHSLELQNIKLTIEYAPQLPGVFANANKLQQVFTNIIINAQQAMPKGGELIILAKVVEKDKKKKVAISFQDSGCGIPQENLERIFEPFFTTKQEMKSLGLGLSICYQIIQEHNGEMLVESQVGKGSKFTVILPLA